MAAEFLFEHNNTEPVLKLLDRCRVQIGRGTDNDVMFADSTVSRYHALITVLDGQVRIRDLQSTNGTFVNGKRVEHVVALRDGDRLSLGRGIQFRISWILSVAPILQPSVRGGEDTVSSASFRPQRNRPARAKGRSRYSSIERDQLDGSRRNGYLRGRAVALQRFDDRAAGQGGPVCAHGDMRLVQP